MVDAFGGSLGTSPRTYEALGASWKALSPDPNMENGSTGRLLIDTGLDADAGAGAPPVSAGSEAQVRSQPSVPGINGVRHISTWLQRNTSLVNSPLPGSRRARLHSEHQELLREHRNEQTSAEELQSRLSSEMRELRDQCHEQGQTVGMLTQRLADFRDAVTAELRAATTVRAALGGELMSEESQRRALEAAKRGEEAEVEIRIEFSEQQLDMMRKVHESLQVQLRTSLDMHGELREYIEAERGGCSELQVASERELTAWNDHNSKVQSELHARLHSEREEVAALRAKAMRESSNLEREDEQQQQEEAIIVAQLCAVREAQEEVRSQMQAEEVAWSHEGERLRERLREVDEECWQKLDAARRCQTAAGACGCERSELQEEVEQSTEQVEDSAAELEHLAERSESLLEELEDLREAVHRGREDDELMKLQKELDMVKGETRQEYDLKNCFESELEAMKRSRGILCWRRRPPSHSPLPPPQGPPPPNMRLQHGDSPERGRPMAKGGGRGPSGMRDEV